MNKEIVKEELHWLIEAINEQYEAISGHDEKIPQIEFDILMENLRKFYENLQLLKRLEDPFSPLEKKKPAVNIPKSVPSAPRETRDQASPMVYTAPRQPRPPASPPATPQNSPKPQSATPPGAETKPAPKKSQKPGEIDLFAPEEPAINAKLREAREKTFSPKIPSGRIENLKSAIIIDDKFMFINELFEGNLREYNETIETLNGFASFDQAADYLDLMRKKNFWNTGSVAFKKLKELVERRY